MSQFHSHEFHQAIECASQLEPDEYSQLMQHLIAPTRVAANLASDSSCRVPSLLMCDPLVQLAMLVAKDEGCLAEFLDVLFDRNLLRWAELQSILPWSEGKLTIGLGDWAITKR